MQWRNEESGNNSDNAITTRTSSGEDDFWKFLLDYSCNSSLNTSHSELFSNAHAAYSNFNSSELYKNLEHGWTDVGFEYPSIDTGTDVNEFQSLELTHDLSMPAEDIESIRTIEDDLKNQVQNLDMDATWSNCSLNAFAPLDCIATVGTPSKFDLKLEGWNNEQLNLETFSPCFSQPADLYGSSTSSQMYLQGGGATRSMIPMPLTAEPLNPSWRYIGQDEAFAFPESAQENKEPHPQRNIRSSITIHSSTLMPHYDGNNAIANYMSATAPCSSSYLQSNPVTSETSEMNTRMQGFRNSNNDQSRWGGGAKHMNQQERSAEITFTELTQYFHMPIAQAAHGLGVGLTVLKKRCREFGIPRWPHRKMKSLKSLIQNIQELGKGNGGLSQARLANAIEILEDQKRMMEEMPGTELAERTKKLRQACFKANYKRRRQMMMSTIASTSASSSHNHIHSTPCSPSSSLNNP